MARAQELADNSKPDMLHKHLDKYAKQLCPVIDVLVKPTTGAFARLSTPPT